MFSNIEIGEIREISENARRQYVDAVTTFEALEAAQHQAEQVRGNMFWKETPSGNYLIKTSLNNAQECLGPKAADTEAIFHHFMQSKSTFEVQISTLQKNLKTHQRLNRALQVGRCPQILVNILRTLRKANLAQHFVVLGAHALYAYEAAAGIRFESGALAKLDEDMLLDNRHHLTILAQMEGCHISLQGLLKKIDPSFKLRDNQQYTAVNNKGFEVSLIKNEADNPYQPQPAGNSLRITAATPDFLALRQNHPSALLNAPPFSCVIVSANGHMERMRTISPIAFGAFKRWVATQADRDPMKRSHDLQEANMIDQMVRDYLPNLVLPT